MQQHTTATAKDTAVAIQSQEDNFPKGKIIDQISCLADASQSYALYIPAVQSSAPLPVIYCFDPHGDGALPLKHYQALANAYHFVLVGSNNSKNGNGRNTTAAIWNTLLSDTKTRLHFDANRIYTLGFSSGAKVASFIALQQNNIQGVIAAGAPLPENAPISNFPFSVTGMAGRGDMNMTDLIALNKELDKTTTTHRLILFDGTHAWPPLAKMQLAFAGLQLDAMRNKTIDKDDSLIQAFTLEMNKQIEQAIAANKLVEAQQAFMLAYNMLQGLTGATATFKKWAAAITTKPHYQQQLKINGQLLAVEQKQKQIFQQQFQQGDIQYWTSTINSLLSKSKAPTAEGAMCQRLLAYLSLAFYSISNHYIQMDQNEAAQHFVTLYKMADAMNSEAWYFSALLQARNGNTPATEADLLKAAGYGFTDTARLLQQPEFQSLSPQLNFRLIESNMKKIE